MNINTNKTSSLKIINVALTLLFLILIIGCQPQKKELAASVNGKEILMDDISERFDKLPAQYKSIITKENLLEQMISEELLLQEADKQNIEIKNEEVEIVIAQLMERGKVTKEQFSQTLAKQNMTYEDFVQLYKRQLTINKVINESVSSKIDITDAEIKTFYDENKELFSAKEGQIRARHILVKNESEAKEILNQLNKGADFVALARNKSVDFGSAQIGGDLGFFNKGQMVKEFEEAAFALDIGEISSITKTQFGYHIIKREGQVIEYKEAKDGIKIILFNQKLEEESKAFVDELRSNADIKIFLGEKTEAKPKKTEKTEQTNKTITEKEAQPEEKPAESKLTFADTGKDICYEDGKPIIRLFSTTTCPHCRWVKTTFDDLMKTLINENKIAAYHWELDTGDNTLTAEIESAIPDAEVELYRATNPKSTVPTYNFGCKYIRIGNAFEEQKDLNKEKEEFIKVIENLI